MGFVYIASNVCFEGLVKIGSCLNVEKRMKTLSNTSVPQNFNCEFYIHDNLFLKIELETHKILETKRISKNKEFFKCSLEEAKKAIFIAQDNISKEHLSICNHKVLSKDTSISCFGNKLKTEKLYVFAPHPTDQSVLVGRLMSSGGVGSFEYAPSWLEDTTHRYALDPKNLPLHKGVFPTQLNKGLHGVFADAGPDSWGRHLMELAGRDLSNPLEQLRLSNGTGTGGLLFSLSQTKPHPARSILPLIELEKLEHTMGELDKGNKINNQELECLFRSGSFCLGGARPKALVEHQSSQWIAKFEKHSDPIPLPPLEWASLQLARQCGIDVPDHELMRCGQRSVLLVKRFDRLPHQERVHYLSAHALLSLIKIGPSDFHSPKGLATYGNIAATARQIGVKNVGEQVFERMLFNIIIGNTDDHFRNHGFLHINNSWELAPAFDMTILGGTEQAIGVGPLGRVRSLENALADCVRFGVSADRALELATNIQQFVTNNIDDVLEQAQLPSGHQGLVKNRLLLTPVSSPAPQIKIKR